MGTRWLAIPFRLPLEGCMGQWHKDKNTDDVHANDLAGRLLDLLELPMYDMSDGFNRQRYSLRT